MWYGMILTTPQRYIVIHWISFPVLLEFSRCFKLFYIDDEKMCHLYKYSRGKLPPKKTVYIFCPILRSLLRTLNHLTTAELLLFTFAFLSVWIDPHLGGYLTPIKTAKSSHFTWSTYCIMTISNFEVLLRETYFNLVLLVNLRSNILK